ncbi:MAG: SlyX family protein [Rhodoblastus sp.]
MTDRLDALEIRIAHQDRTIAELNETVTLQWRRIDALEREVRTLREEVRNSFPERDAPEPPPPHY